jgi:hypothetical protein
MGDFSQIAKIFVGGVVTIGIFTALFSNGRQTAAVTKTVFAGAQGLLHTAESG